MKTILISGIYGYTGTYLSKYIENIKNYKIIGIDKVSSSNGCIQADLANKDIVLEVLSEYKPDYIINLAGSYSNNYETDYANNVIVAKNILDSLIETNLPETKTLIISSSSIYGSCEKGQMISENHPINPVSAYARTKLELEILSQNYINNTGLNIIIARTFNIIGPGMSSHLFIGNLFKQIRQYLNHQIKKIKLGNINGYRDYVDIRDVISAYFLLITTDLAYNIFNVGCGEAVKISDILAYTCEKTGIPDENIRPDNSENLKEISYQCADISRIEKMTSWKPRYNWQQSIDNILKNL